jgi:hypothetical protein
MSGNFGHMQEPVFLSFLSAMSTECLLHLSEIIALYPEALCQDASQLRSIVCIGDLRFMTSSSSKGLGYTEVPEHKKEGGKTERRGSGFEISVLTLLLLF